MADVFDPYLSWLKIPPGEQPPDHYRLLGIERSGWSADAIRAAAEERIAFLRQFQLSSHAAEAERLMNEVAAASVCLANPEKKAAYDAGLSGERSSVAAIPGAAGASRGIGDAMAEWFQIPAAEQPPDHYRLLGVVRFETMPAVIRGGMQARFAQLLPHQSEHGALVVQLREQVSEAVRVILDPQSRAEYDRQLRVRMAEQDELRRREDLWRMQRPVLLRAGIGSAIAVVLLAGAFFLLRGRGAEQAAAPPAVAVPDEPPSAPPPPPPPPPPPASALPKDSETPAASDGVSDLLIKGTGSSIAPSPPPYLPAVPAGPMGIKPAMLPDSERSPSPRRSRGSRVSSPVSAADAKEPPKPASPVTSRLLSGITLPSGRVFRLATFATDDAAIERLVGSAINEDDSPEYEAAAVPRRKGVSTIARPTTQMLAVKSVGHFSLGYINHNGGKLEGICVTLYDEQHPNHVATYTNNRRSGALKKWSQDGQRLYWCQYDAGKRNGFCCLFHRGEPKAIGEWDTNRLEWLHLLSGDHVEESIDGGGPSAGEGWGATVLARIEAIEDELQEIDRLLIGKAVSVARKSAEAEKQRLASKLNPAKRAAIADRINSQRQQRASVLGGLKKASGL